MKNSGKAVHLPVIVTALGGIALVLRRVLYAVALDEKGLLPMHHPLEVGLGIFSAAALLYILITVWKLGGSANYEDNFSASTPAAMGHALAAVGILLTVLQNKPVMQNYLGTIWLVLGLASGICLLLAGQARKMGKQPFFLLHLIPCLFLVFHIINHYQMWSGNPQFQDYGVTLFGSMALVFFAFYTAAFDVDAGQRRMQLFMGLTAVYMLLAELALTRYPWLYLGGIAWALTDLCSLTPVPKPEDKKET